VAAVVKKLILLPCAFPNESKAFFLKKGLSLF
jgi:hypothetical protein